MHHHHNNAKLGAVLTLLAALGYGLYKAAVWLWQLW